jgi:hypothetical protein
MNLKDDVWDWDILVKLANDLPQDRLSEVRKFVEDGIKFAVTEEPRREVSTLIDLMALLSNETHEDAGKGVLDEPDPHGKIQERFSIHSEYLLEQYCNYFSEYGKVLDAIMKREDLGTARMRRLGLHLSTKSNRFLKDASGNPERALNVLVEFYVETLQKHGKSTAWLTLTSASLDSLIHLIPAPRCTYGLPS